MITCQHCGVEFEPRGAHHTKFCTLDCQMRHRYERERAERDARREQRQREAAEAAAAQD